MKKYYLLAAVLATFVSCASDEFTGEQNNREMNESGAISFSMSTPAVTRALGSDAASALGYKFKVYGVKKNSSTYSNVFATGGYSSEASYNADPDAYWVWYTATTAGTTTSNTKDWDYVGAAGTHGTSGYEADISSGKDQTIKYWDYSADQYEFVAYSATVKDATTPYSITNYNKDGFTITATAAELAGLFIADKLTISTKDEAPSKPANDFNKIGDIVKFTFRSSGTKVRLGIYETIPGYVVKNVNFRPNASEFTATTINATLSGSFNGSSSGASGKYNVTYASSTPQIAIFTRNSDTGTEDFRASYFNFGTFTSTSAIGETSTAPTWAGSATYQSVLPNTDNVSNMILYVDYDLYNASSGETIHVTGAKAVVPEMYMTWNPNYAYTYLFKISDNTNGQTKPGEGIPVGLFPITFDAVTIAATDGAEVGTITTISTPAITTYQEGSVSTAGITYAATNKPIYITVNTNGTLASLSTDNIKLYTVEAGTTESDLMLTTKTKTPVTSGSDVISILSQDETLQGISFKSRNAAKFTPTAGTTYAVEYTESTTKYYKIIVVAASGSGSGS